MNSFSYEQEVFEMILTSQKCNFDIKKKVTKL